nr:CheR family methyltransferase [Paraburkholderia hospita]
MVGQRRLDARACEAAHQFLRARTLHNRRTDCVAHSASAARSDEPLRVWVPGCATGEEAYSMAILLTEEIEKRNASRKFKILASDVNRAALARARAGVYAPGVALPLGERRLARFFHVHDDGYPVPPSRISGRMLREYVEQRYRLYAQSRSSIRQLDRSTAFWRRLLVRDDDVARVVSRVGDWPGIGRTDRVRRDRPFCGSDPVAKTGGWAARSSALFSSRGMVALSVTRRPCQRFQAQHSPESFHRRLARPRVAWV